MNKIKLLFLLMFGLLLITYVSAQVGINFDNSGSGEHLECGCSWDGKDDYVNVDISCSYYGEDGQKIPGRISIFNYNNEVLNKDVNENEKIYLCGCKSLNLNLSVFPPYTLDSIIKGKIFNPPSQISGENIVRGRVIEEMAYINYDSPCLYCQEWDEELSYLEAYKNLKDGGFDVSEYEPKIISDYRLSLNEIDERIQELKELLMSCKQTSSTGENNGEEVGFNGNKYPAPEFDILTLILTFLVSLLTIFIVKRRMI